MRANRRREGEEGGKGRRRRRRTRRRVSVQEGSPPPLACTAEVGFFYMDIYIHAHIYIIYTERRRAVGDEDEKEG